MPNVTWAIDLDEFFVKEEPTEPNIPVPHNGEIQLIQGFWDRQPTVKVDMCGHCVRPIQRCSCPVEVVLTEMDLEAA